MEGQGTVVLIGNSQTTIKEIETDLEYVGYGSVVVPFAKISMPDIARLTPMAVLILLHEWDDEKLHACELIMEKDALPPGVPVLALITENTMRKVSRKYIFSDIIILPCRRQEIEFRLSRAIYYAQQKVNRDIVTIDDISISLLGYEVYVKDKLITLTFKEFELLKHLMLNPGRVFNRESLLDMIWGYDYLGGTRTVDVHIRRVRAKLGDYDETHIKTVRGIGYTFRSNS